MMLHIIAYMAVALVVVHAFKIMRLKQRIIVLEDSLLELLIKLERGTK